MKIWFQDLQVNSVSNSSGIFSGDNIHLNWKHSRKTNDGFGSIQGNSNISKGNVHIVFDRDVVDVFKK
ncbi:hypothetical protein VF724_01310 [Paenibacillaceae bacterium T2]|uniref:Uncharacterized protein n=1 Tax=Ferviditalea candida TaxID=3108399 RepID=A0ABU5ZG64_9BACL|nr:hypothetical protein [Paenibacillaceae bacterium T2]